MLALIANLSKTLPFLQYITEIRQFAVTVLALIAVGVKLIQSFDVLIAHPYTLSNSNTPLPGNDCILAVGGERGRTVMHHAIVVVRDTKILDHVRAIAIKVAHFVRRDGTVVDLNVKVPIGCTLHVDEAQRVKELVDDGTARHATVGLQIHRLSASHVPKNSPTSGVGTLNREGNGSQTFNQRVPGGRCGIITYRH